jgi:lipopolysaccharide/colanic/teichoic acid biosynthesis glycosyltransferase
VTANPDIQSDNQTQSRFRNLTRHSDLLRHAGPSRPLYRGYLKALLDAVVVIISAPFVLPVVAVLALLIACRGGTAFYVQERVGQNGKIYKMWKLRTMCDKADLKLEDYLASNKDARIEWDSTQKLKDDPRVTRFGRFLRKSSLDELPQLWNVLKGDMSLVGPRPMMTQQKNLYPGTAYYRLRPGITGSWQISDRNKSTFAERAIYDESYDAAVSLKTDLKILAGTVRVVLRGTGH